MYRSRLVKDPVKDLPKVNTPATCFSTVKSGDQVDSQFLGSRTLDPLGLGPLAQLAERRADNAEVGGSSPPRPTRSKN